MLKDANSVMMWILIFILIVASFLLLIKAYKLIPVGIAYAVFVGIGTVGTYIVSITFLGETTSKQQVVFLILLLIGIIGLKLTTKEERE
ncbi:paired small multidrug resistance pump [Pelosinus propionicus DSM 13327]|uniref:Paired small multidrug resistance pump n=2 Tax=Pelosinus TaxID=365348 RepID=A0A1I4H099_9FIRM|nr:paired small multidrug resistance pump [Pelosinus propionicus DSM 13327]